MATLKRNKNKIYIGSMTFDGILIVLMLAASLIFIYPFVNVIAVSLSSNRMISNGLVSWYPREFNTLGYELLFKESNIWGAYWNTIVIALGATAFSLVLTSMLAYALMLPEFVLKRPLTIYLLITMFFSGGTIPTYLLIKDLGLIDSWWSLILPIAVSAYNVFVYRAFYRGISIEIREAATVDGAGHFRILASIYVPLSKALYATFGLFSLVNVWNSYYDALLYIRDSSRQPIQMILRKIVFTSGTSAMEDVTLLLNNGSLNAKNVQYACILATIGPILLVYPFLQKYFAQGMQLGAVKG